MLSVGRSIGRSIDELTQTPILRPIILLYRLEVTPVASGSWLVWEVLDWRVTSQRPLMNQMRSMTRMMMMKNRHDGS